MIKVVGWGGGVPQVQTGRDPCDSAPCWVTSAQQPVDRRQSTVRLNLSPCPKLAHHELIAVAETPTEWIKQTKVGGLVVMWMCLHH